MDRPPNARYDAHMDPKADRRERIAFTLQIIVGILTFASMVVVGTLTQQDGPGLTILVLPIGLGLIGLLSRLYD